MNERETICDEITAILRRDLQMDGDFPSDVSLASLGLDSVQVMQLIVYMEQSFAFEFPADSTMDSALGLSLRDLAAMVTEAAPSNRTP
jgi:acyl carrier protein